MDQSLLVQVFTPTFGDHGADGGGQTGRTGTAFPVGNGLILTALHVVRPADRDERYPISVLWTADPQPRWRDLGADPIAWSGEPRGLDAALLRCAAPFEIPWPGVPLAETPVDRAPWTSAGFPDVGKTVDTRRWHGFSGRTYALASTERTFELDVTGARPRDELDWRGASGMPVSTPNTNLIQGVVTAVPKGFTGDRLTATPTSLMHRDEAFRRVLGLGEPRRGSLDRFRRRLAHVLGGSTRAMDRLAAAMPSRGDSAPASGRADALAERLMSRTFTEAMNALWAAFRPLDEDREFAAEDDLKALGVLETAAQVIAPALFDAGLIDGVRAQKIDPHVSICRLYSSIPTVAELVMAGVDGRPAAYHGRRDLADAPFGKRNLVMLPPEGGIGSEPERARQLREDLARKLAPGQWRQIRQRLDDHMIAALVPGALRDDSGSNIRRAANELEQLSTGGSGYYLLCALPASDEARREVEAGLRAVKADYPALVILAMDDVSAQDQDMNDRRTEEMKRISAFRLMIPMERRWT